MELDIYVVDAFTDQQFKGNSAAVIPLENWIDDNLMQKIAIENICLRLLSLLKFNRAVMKFVGFRL